MEKAKSVNYTTEATAKAVAEYKAGTAVEDIATALGKTVRSVVAKLSREGVYTKKEYKAKTGEAVISKADLVAEIATKLGVEAEVIESLELATKATLKLILAAV